MRSFVKSSYPSINQFSQHFGKELPVKKVVEEGAPVLTVDFI